MIKYNLTCKVCSKLFDSWFASSKEFEKLKKLNYLTCPSCNSLNIDKSLMSPSVLTTKKQKNTLDDQKHKKEVRKKIKEYQKFIKNNFDFADDIVHHLSSPNPFRKDKNLSDEEFCDLKVKELEDKI